MYLVHVFERRPFLNGSYVVPDDEGRMANRFILSNVAQQVRERAVERFDDRFVQPVADEAQMIRIATT